MREVQSSATTPLGEIKHNIRIHNMPMSNHTRSNRRSRVRDNGNGNGSNALSSPFKRMSSKRALLPMIRMNASISSICEDEPVIAFDDSGLTDMSSLSCLTCSNSSLIGPVTQGPSLFDESSSGAGRMDNRATDAPKMPRRGPDSRRNLMLSGSSLQLTNDNDNDVDDDDEDSIDDFDDASVGSLTLEDIVEESNHSSSTRSTVTTKSRQWNDSGPKLRGMSIPTRVVDSLHHQNSGLSFGMDSSATIQFSDVEDDVDDDNDDDDDDDSTVSFASGSTKSSFAEGDSFSQLKISSTKIASSN